MSDEWWGLGPAVSGVLEARGWERDDDTVRQVLPAVARHGNAVVAVPPTPARAAPALAGIAAAVQASKGRALVLAAPAMVEPLGREIAQLAAASELRVVTATGPARAARRLAEGNVDLLVCSPATALALHTRSALRVDGFTAIALAWPEDWDADEALTVLLADLAREAQRVVLTGDPRAVVDLVERHVRRSLTVGFPEAPEVAEAAAGAIRTYATPWGGRTAAIAGVIELLDPAAMAVWTADRSDDEALGAALAELPAGTLVHRELPDAPLVICHDLPTPAELAALSAGREVVLVVPPGTEGYVSRLAPAARPIRQAGSSDLARDRDAALRAEIAALIEHKDLTAAGYALAPLFDRFDPQAVAAACFALWRRGPVGTPVAGAPAAAEPVEPPTPVGGVARSKIWVGVGRRDDATPGDLVAVLIKEVGLSREAVGRIELRETFSLVEVPTDQADRVAAGLTGLTIRRRKLVARVDRGLPSRGGGGGGGGPRSGGRPPRRHGG